MTTAPISLRPEPRLDDYSRDDVAWAVNALTEREQRRRLEDFDYAIEELAVQVTKLRELAVGDRHIADRGFFLQEVDEVNDEIQRALRDVAEVRKDLEA